MSKTTPNGEFFSSRLERLVIVLAAAVCLLWTAMLRDVSDRALWMPQLVAPPLPDSVGARLASLTVKVADQDEAPAAGVLVRVFALVDGEAYLAKSATTGPEGEARLDALPVGEVWVIAERAGLARTSSRLVLEPGERTLTVRLERAESFEVVVVDPMQRPIRGVTVTLYGADPLPYRASTDDRGLALFEGLGPAPYAVEVTATGFDTKLIAEVGVHDSPLFVKLERLGSLEVAVVDTEGKPVPDATVLVAGSSLWPARSATTNERGTVMMSGLSHGFFDLRAEKDDRVSDSEHGVLLERGDSKRVTLTLVSGSFVTVLVTDGEADDAKPVAGADVALVEGGISSFPRYGRTGEDGKVRLGPVVGADATVSARADGFVPRSAAPLDEGQAEVRIALVRGGTLVGRVIDERDFPVDGVRLEVIGVDLSGMPIVETSAMASFREDHFAFALPGATPLIPMGELGVMPVIPDIPRELGPLVVTRAERDADGGWVSRSDGTFEVKPVTPGRVRIVARHPEYIETVSDPVDLTTGGKAELTIVMKKGGILEGRVLELDRSPVPGARIEVASSSMSADRITYAAEDGSFAFAALPLEVIVSVARPEAPDHVVEKMILEIPRDQRQEVEIILPRKREPVLVRVVDDRGYPLDRTEIHASSLSADEPLTRTLFSDDVGEAELPHARALPLRFVLLRTGKAPAVFQIERAPAVLVLTLVDALAAVGRVVDRHGSVEGAELTLMTPTGSKKVRTDAAGEFRFEELAVTEARLLVMAKGRVPLERDVVVEGDSRRPVDLGTFELDLGGSAQGRVLDANGEPVAGARVAPGRVPTYLPLGPLPPGIAATDAKGEFLLEDLPAGKTVIEAYKAGYGRELVSGIEIRAGEVNSRVEIKLYEDPEVDLTEAGTTGSLAVTLSDDMSSGRRIVVFVHVPLGGEAQRAGILGGDMLLAVNGRPIRSIEQARRAFNGPLSEDFVVELARAPDMRWLLRVRRERLRQ